MNRIVAFLKAHSTQVNKAIVAFIVPNVPAIVAVVQRDYGTAAGAEVVAVATALGVYRTPNASAPVPAEAPGPITPTPAP